MFLPPVMYCLTYKIKKMKRVYTLLYIVLFSISAYAQEKETNILIETTMGNITIKLYNETPQHRDNFIKLAKENRYDSVMFHRIVKQFMIQAGEKYAPEDTVAREAEEKEFNYKIPAEIIYPKFFHKKGQLCAARTPNQVNPKRESSPLQFYIVTGKHYTDNELDKIQAQANITFTPEQREAYKIEGGTPFLDNEYTVFGEVVKGMNVVQKIEGVQTGQMDKPVKDIRIKKMKILN